MKITLYKKCILSNSYSEVFDNKQKYSFGAEQKTALENYLDTLDKFETIQDSVYMTNRGTFYFELTSPNNWADIYEYNYIKCEQNDFIRYCFIDDIQIGNGVAVISYSEDIWHSYSKDITIRNSYLSYALENRYRYGKIIKVRELPISYSSNEGIEYKTLANINADTTYYLIAQAQKYSLVSGGNVGSRETYTVIVGLSYGSERQLKLKYSDALYAMLQMVNTQSNKYGNHYFEFDNFTLFPSEYMGNYELPLNQVGLTEYDQSMPLGYSDHLIRLYNLVTTNTADKYIYGATYTVQNDYKTIGLGTFGSEYGIINNGTDYQIKFMFFASLIDFKIIINYFGKMIDVTSEFVIDVPYNSINGETQAQRKIARQTATVNGALKIVNGVAEVATDIATFGASTATKSTSTAIRYSGIDRKITSVKGSTTTSYGGGGSVGGIIGGASDIVSGITQIIQANKPQYQTTYGAFVLGNKEMNCKYGIMVKKIIPDNEDEVQKIIKNIGYKVYEIVDEDIMYPQSPFVGGKINVNVLKFEFVNAYGNAPQNVIDAYKKILIDGVKIWYWHTAINNV